MTYVIPEPREIPEWLEKGRLPTQFMADLLHRHAAALAAAGARTDQARQQAERLAEVFGLALYRKLDSPAATEFRTFVDALQAVGVELITHRGEPFVGDLEELADVVDWIDSADGIAPGSVAEAFEPEIRLSGRFVHRAKLICVRDRPTADEPQTETVEAGDDADLGAEPTMNSGPILSTYSRGRES